jgi:2-haloacid dehalogenase
VAALAEALFPGHGVGISQVWRDKQIEYTRLVTTCNDGAHYQPFSTLTRAALKYAIKKVAGYGRPQTSNAQFEVENAPAIDRLMAQYNQLTAYPENRAVLQALKAKGVVTGILSNGDPPMLQAAVHSAGLADVLDHVISVDTVKKYKTHPAAYALGETATGLAADRIAFVSSNSWDALAATWFGYQTLWVNRQNMPFDELATSPTYQGTTLRDVLALFP